MYIIQGLYFVYCNPMRLFEPSRRIGQKRRIQKPPLILPVKIFDFKSIGSEGKRGVCTACYPMRRRENKLCILLFSLRLLLRIENNSWSLLPAFKIPMRSQAPHTPLFPSEPILTSRNQYAPKEK